MRFALAALLAGCSADNATNPLPKAAALLEAANKLRAEAAALEAQAQAEAVNRLLDDPELRFSLAAEAQKRASAYQCANGLKAWMRLLSGYSDQTAP